MINFFMIGKKWKKIMSRPIMPTPTLTGKDAELFIKDFLEAERQEKERFQPRISAKEVYANVVKILKTKKLGVKNNA